MCHFSHYLTLIFEGLVAFLGVQEWFEQGLPFMEIKYIDFSTQSIFNALPIISLAYMCQMTVFPVWNELETPSFGRASPLMCSLSCRSYQKSSTFFYISLIPISGMNLVVIVMTLIAFTLYSIVGFFGYMIFDTLTGILQFQSAHYRRHPIVFFASTLDLTNCLTESDVIDNLPHEVFYDVVRAVFGVAILFHYPVRLHGSTTSSPPCLPLMCPPRWSTSLFATQLSSPSSISTSSAGSGIFYF